MSGLPPGRGVTHSDTAVPAHIQKIDLAGHSRVALVFIKQSGRSYSLFGRSNYAESRYLENSSASDSAS